MAQYHSHILSESYTLSGGATGSPTGTGVITSDSPLATNSISLTAAAVGKAPSLGVGFRLIAGLGNAFCMLTRIQSR